MMHDCKDDDETKAHIHGCRLSLARHLALHYASFSPPASTASSSSRPVPDDNSDLFARFRRDPNNNTTSIEKELDRYLALDPNDAIDSGLSSLKWWQQHEHQFPRVARLARDVFACPSKSFYTCS